jgi:hypothetical protein
MWHIDTTVIRLLDGTRAYLHAVIDNFSRRILAWRVAETFAPVNSVAVLLDAGRAATPSVTAPVVLADAGVENVNSTNTTACFRIRRFAGRRRTKCTSAREIRSPRT